MVIDAATSLLVDVQWENLTVDVIAERAGVHRATVYRRWGDVGGVLADVFDAAADDEWQPADTGSLLGDLTAINQEVFDALAEPSSVTRALIDASFRSEQAAGALREFWRDRYRRCAVVVERAVQRGEVPPGIDGQRVVVASTAPIYHRLVLWREPADPALVEEAARDAVAAARAQALVG